MLSAWMYKGNRFPGGGNAMFLNDCLVREYISARSLFGSHLLSRWTRPRIRVIHHGPSTANHAAAVHKSNRLADRCVLIGPFKRCTYCPKPIHLPVKGAGQFIGPPLSGQTRQPDVFSRRTRLFWLTRRMRVFFCFFFIKLCKEAWQSTCFGQMRGDECQTDPTILPFVRM